MAEASRGWATPDLGSPTRFIMLRHGQTEDSVHHLFSGSGGTDPQLTELGHQQAHAAARRLSRIAVTGEFTAIYASPLQRAQETAKYASEALEIPVITDERLTECNFGEWEGYTMAEVLERYPEEASQWMKDPECTPPGGECLKAVLERTQNFRDEILETHQGKNILMVSHVTPIKSLVWEGMGEVDSVFYRLFLDLGSLSVVEFYKDGGSTVRMVNYGGAVLGTPS